MWLTTTTHMSILQAAAFQGTQTVHPSGGLHADQLAQLQQIQRQQQHFAQLAGVAQPSLGHGQQALAGVTQSSLGHGQQVHAPATPSFSLPVPATAVGLAAQQTARLSPVAQQLQQTHQQKQPQQQGNTEPLTFDELVLIHGQPQKVTEGNNWQRLLVSAPKEQVEALQKKVETLKAQNKLDDQQLKQLHERLIIQTVVEMCPTYARTIQAYVEQHKPIVKNLVQFAKISKLPAATFKASYIVCV
jgi:hypothetical protein